MYAQVETNNWYFVKNVGFPIAVTNGNINTNKDCDAISSPAEQLLFYTDGVTFYNRNYQIMATAQV